MTIDHVVDLRELNTLLVDRLKVKRRPVAPGEMFIAIPRTHFRYIVELIENFRIDLQHMRELIMPSHAPHV